MFHFFTSKYTLLVLFALNTCLTKAQIEVGVRYKDGRQENISQTQEIKIKNSECLFIVPKKLEQSFSEILDKNWTISKWAISTDVNMNTEPNDKNIFTIHVNPGPNPQTPIISLGMSMKDYNGNILQIADIILQPKAEAITAIQSLSEEQAQRQVLFEISDFYNLSYDLLENNIRAVNNLLSQGKSLWADNRVLSQAHIQLLSHQSLFIPEYCFYRRNMINGLDEKVESEKLLKKYPHQWITESTKEKRFVLMYAQSGASLYIGIFDTLSGQYIYHEKKSNKYKLSSNDFKDIADIIG
jgi:hypothetical protein